MGEVLSVKLDHFVFYGQLVVHDEKAADILQDWTEQDSEQGFSWEPKIAYENVILGPSP